MKLESTLESLKAAKKLLGMPEDARIDFEKLVVGDKVNYVPVIKWQGVKYQIGDEIPDLVGQGTGEESPV